MLANRLSGDIGDGQWHHQCRAHRRDTGRRGGQSQRAITSDIEHAVVLRRGEERREHRPADGGDSGDLADGAGERQAQRRHRTRVGKAGRDQRVGESQHSDPGGDHTGEHRDRGQHRADRVIPWNGQRNQPAECSVASRA